MRSPYLWRFGITVDYGASRGAQTSSFIWEMLAAAQGGGRSSRDDVIYDPAALVAYLEEHGVTEASTTLSLKPSWTARREDLHKRPRY